MQEKNNLKKEDLEVLKFLSKYKILKVEDATFIYHTKRYYRDRINKLIDKGYVKRYKSYIILDKNGRKILGEVGQGYIKNIKNEAYMERLKKIASIATLEIDSNIKFEPSWLIKDKDIFTETARRYIGKMIIDGKEYLTYYLSKKKEDVYIKQLLFDINKSFNYNKIIIFVEDFNVICPKYSNFAFGKEETIVILNNNDNKNFLKKYININWHEILEDIYQEELLISNWDKADYLLEDNRYIIEMIFINTEKIERLNWYYSENVNSTKRIEIITLEENKEKIKEMIGDNRCSIKVIDKNWLGGILEC